MKTLKEVARAGRFAAMQPAAVAERLALNQALACVAHDGACSGHHVITLDSAQAGCKVWTGSNAVWLYPPLINATCWRPAVSIGRQHGQPNGKTWFGTERATDAQGRSWERSFDAVIDDFGNLVEVPQ